MHRFLSLILSGSILLTGVHTMAQETVAWQAQAQELIDSERFADAATHCGRWLNVLEAEFGVDAPETSQALSCVGDASLALGKLGQAEVMFSRTITLVEEKAGVFDYRLVRPLYGLGQAYAIAGNFEAAESAMIRAKDITHRNKGIFNLEQTDIVSRLSSLYYNQGEYNDAQREQRFLLQANEETYGETPQLLGALRRMAKWYQLTGETLKERDLYRRAINISEAFYGPDDLRMIGPLRDFANSYIETPRVNRVFSREGQKSLARVIDILQAQEFVDQADLAEAWSDLGDWYTLSGSRGRSRSAYNKAWTIAPKGDATAQQDSYDYPVEIEYEPWPVRIQASKLKNVPSGELEIVFEFTVSDTGRVKRLTLVKDDVGIRDVINQIGINVRHSRYRPRMIDGLPVATPGVRKSIKLSLNNLRQQALANEAAAEANSEEAIQTEQGESAQEGGEASTTE